MNTEEINGIFELFYRNITVGFKETVNKLSKKYKLSYEQYILLKQIRKAISITGSELAQLSNISRAAISRRCRELADMGYINRLSDLEPDYRVTQFTMSKKGEVIVDKLNKDYDELFKKLSEEFGEQEFKIFASEVNKFNQLLHLNIE